MIPDEEIALLKERREAMPWRVNSQMWLDRLLSERERFVKEHRAMLPLLHGDITKGAIDPLFEAWGQVEAFK